MTNQAEPGRPPAHDLSAFDLTKRSPEQVAQSFARWKAQRKRPPEAASQPLQAQPSTAIEQDAAPDPSLAHETPKPASKRAKPVEYSDTFSALLAAGSEPTVQRAAWTPIGERPSPKRSRSPGRRLKAMSVLAGAASVLALAGGALLELSDWRDSTEAEPEVAQIHPQQIPMAGPIAAAATRAPSVEWKLQRTVDLALMNAAPDADAAKPVQPTPEPPMVQTASKAAIAAPPRPAPKKAAPETEQFVVKPFVPSAAPAPAVVPAAQGTAAIPAPPVAAVARSGDPRPDALFQYSRDKSTGTASNRVASGGKPAAATGSESAVDARSATTRTATARSGKVVNGGNGDPRGEGSGGASVGPAAMSASGGDAGDASAGSDTGSGNTGDDGATDGGSASSDAGGSDTGGADTGAAAGGDTSGDTGGDDAGDASGSGDSGDGDSGDGDSGSSDGEDGDSGGIGGAIGGALGGVGDALGGALDGNGNPDSED